MMNKINNWKLKRNEADGTISWQGSYLKLSSSFKIQYYFLCDMDNKILYKTSIEDFTGFEIGKCKDGIDTSDICITDRYLIDNLEVIRSICYNSFDISSFRTRIELINRGSKAVSLSKITPVFVEGNNLDLQSPVSDWSFYRQGRQKNDLPSVCILGGKDDAYSDALSGLKESGGGVFENEGENPCTLISDELTVLKGNFGRGPSSLTIGFITGASQLVECKVTTDQQVSHFICLEASCIMDDVILFPGESIESEWVRVDGNIDTFKAINDFAMIKANIYKPRKSQIPPSVYCTWYYYGNTVTYNDIKENLNEIVNRKLPIDVFQIDGGWTNNAGDWEANKKFEGIGMKRVADEIKEAGLIPGIWTSPFILEQNSELSKNKPHWLLKRKNGEYSLFYMANKFRYVLDITHPEVLVWIRELYHKLTYDWGYIYHKLDFTRAVVIEQDNDFYDKTVTRAQAYRRAVEAIRKGAGEKAYIVICGGLYDPVIGLVDAQRSTSDVLSMWTKPEGHRGGKVVPFTIKQNLLRYWMNRWWDNDPDSLMIRRKTEMYRNLDLSLGLLNDDEANLSTLNQYLGGGMICITEPMAEIEYDRLGLLRHIVPVIGIPAIPRDMFLGKRFPEVYDVEIAGKATELGIWHTTAIVNWSDESINIKVALDEELVGSFAKTYKKYCISEFFSGRIIDEVKYGEIIDLGDMAPHSPKLLKIIPCKDEEPILVYANGHFSMGETEIINWVYKDDSLNIGIDWRWEYPLELVIKSPINKKWVDHETQNIKVMENQQYIKIKVDDMYYGNLILRLN